MSGETIHVTVTVDTDELRRWADRHADAGNHGVAHVLYKAASDGESLTEQVVTKAKANVLREAADDIVTDWAPVWGGTGMWFTTGNAVAELVADTLRSMASEIES